MKKILCAIILVMLCGCSNNPKDIKPDIDNIQNNVSPSPSTTPTPTPTPTAYPEVVAGEKDYSPIKVRNQYFNEIPQPSTISIFMEDELNIGFIYEYGALAEPCDDDLPKDKY